VLHVFTARARKPPMLQSDACQYAIIRGVGNQREHCYKQPCIARCYSGACLVTLLLLDAYEVSVDISSVRVAIEGATSIIITPLLLSLNPRDRCVCASGCASPHGDCRPRPSQSTFSITLWIPTPQSWSNSGGCRWRSFSGL
jgi:hypothetical protein